MTDRQRLQHLAQINDVLLVDLSRMAEWTEDLYWDQVHPNPFGNVILASALGEVIRTRAPWLHCSGAR
jgi:lysophospholipase L1-like esterase